MVRGGGEAAAAAETKAPGIFSPNSGVPTYLHSLAFRLRRERDGDFLQKSKKKFEKPKREKDFSFLLSNEVLRSAIISFKSVIQKLIDNK